MKLIGLGPMVSNHRGDQESGGGGEGEGRRGEEEEKLEMKLIGLG
jgi:hypothetical protein